MLVAAAVMAMLVAWTVLGGAALLTPHHDGASSQAFLGAVAMWLTMAVAMMTPTVLPWIAAYVTLVAPPGGGTPWQAVGTFAAGYFAVWFLYSAGAAALQIGLSQAGLLMGDRVGTTLGALVLVAAGAFQFVPLKSACLAHCRSPLSYFIARWKDGPIGGFRLGVSHGAYCLGCCWLVMLTALVMGVMNLAWMAVLTVMVALEQLAPGGMRMARVCGVLLALWGAWLALASRLGVAAVP